MRVTAIIAALASTLLTTHGAAQEAPLAPAAADVAVSAAAEAARRGDRAALVVALESGTADLAGGDRDGTPALHSVVRTGDIDLARRLVAAGADVNATSRHGVTPLAVAIGTGNAAMTRWLLEAGATASTADRTGEPPLLKAARTGAADVVAALLAQGVAVDSRDAAFGQTALMMAARAGHLEVATLLLDAGADPNAATHAEEPPRFMPPSESPPGLSKGIGIVRAGWPEGRGKRFPTDGGKTALLYAAREGRLAVAKLLVERGAALEQADGNGMTPLLAAIVNANLWRVARTGATEHLALAHALLDAGAEVDTMDWYGETPLWAAVDLRNLEKGPADKSNTPEIRAAALALIERLLAAGADPNVRTKEFPHERRYIVVVVGSVAWADLTGMTPFLRAAAAGDLTVMRLLLEHGADPNIATANGTTPLMAAAGMNFAVGETYTESDAALLEAVKLAHELGNDVGARNSMGLAAVHAAANRGANDVIEYLAQHGARLDEPDREGRTPLDWAAGVFLATHPPVRKPETIALLERLLRERDAAVAIR